MRKNILLAMGSLVLFSSLLCIADENLFSNTKFNNISDKMDVLDSSQPESPKEEHKNFKNAIEARAGYYYPTNERFREIYSGGGIYGVEYRRQMWQRLFLWTEVDYFYQTGKTDIDVETSSGSSTCALKKIKPNHTQITLVPCSLGLKYFFNKGPGQFYLGAGGLATFLHTHVNSKHLVKESSKWGFGGAFKGGFLYHVGKAFLIDLFTDYYLVEAHPHRTRHRKVITRSADLSGFTFGGALGCAF